MSVVIWILLAAGSAVVDAEVVAWSGRGQLLLLSWSARKLPAEQRDRYREEWRAELEQVPDGPVTRAVWVLSIASRSGKLAKTLRGPRWRPSGLGWMLKRSSDLAFAALALLLLAPVLVACAVALTIECGPGVLFRQVRVGKDGRSFAIYRFRSIKMTCGFPEVGPVGRFMRRTSLDELPQLWNVVRGDMALVGPRPDRPHLAAQFSDRLSDYRERHRVRAGLTGLAQVEALHHETSIKERVQYGNEYIRSWTLWLDIKILAHTVWSALRP